MPMPTYRGTHGTTQLCAAEILLNGFRLSEGGRAGKGAYFWQYFTDATTAKKLAVGWYDSQVRRRAYTERNPQCAIIDATFDVDDDAFLDCTGEILEQIIVILRKLTHWSEEDISDTYERLINRMETLSGKQVLLIRASVSPPQKMSLIEKQVMPHSSILVVRHEAVKITAKLVES